MLRKFAVLFVVVAVAGAFALDFPVFVGKGEVQTALGWNNKQLQEGAEGLTFTVRSVTETTWLCYNSASGNTLERNNTVTTQGVVSAVTRDRNQVTGFFITRYEGTPTTTTEGQATGNCPGMNSSLVAGSIEEGEASGFTLFVDGVPLN